MAIVCGASRSILHIDGFAQDYSNSMANAWESGFNKVM